MIFSCPLWVVGQSAAKKEMPPPSYKPTGIRVGTDLISLVKIPLSEGFDGWEVNTDIDFYKYYLTLDVGNWSKLRMSDTQTYTNSGNYFRIGADVNLLLKDPDRNMFFLGLRYGRSSFEEQLDFITEDPVFGTLQKSLNNPSVTASWAEITLGLRVKMWKHLWMGYTARLKLSPSIKNNGQLDTFDIPGYGRASESTYWGFNYQLFWRFPLRKTVLLDGLKPAK